MSTFLQTLIGAVLIQLVGVLGIFFLFGFILSKIQRAIQGNYQRSVGWKGILWTAWLGTPIHELSHVFFAWLFRHRIHDISLFRPNRDEGTLGHVDHSFNKFSLYQRMGSFFVGAAPMILGPMVLTALLYILVPNAKEIFNPLIDTFDSFGGFWTSLIALAKLVTFANISSWKFWLFVYLSFCIASHLAPSRADLRTMWGGFFWFLVILIVANAFAMVLDVDLTTYILRVNQYLGIFTAIFLYATVISLIHYIFSRLVSVLFGRDHLIPS